MTSYHAVWNCGNWIVLQTGVFPKRHLMLCVLHQYYAKAVRLNFEFSLVTSRFHVFFFSVKISMLKESHVVSYYWNNLYSMLCYSTEHWNEIPALIYYSSLFCHTVFSFWIFVHTVKVFCTSFRQWCEILSHLRQKCFFSDKFQERCTEEDVTNVTQIDFFSSNPCSNLSFASDIL